MTCYGCRRRQAVRGKKECEWRMTAVADSIRLSARMLRPTCSTVAMLAQYSISVEPKKSHGSSHSLWLKSHSRYLLYHVMVFDVGESTISGNDTSSSSSLLLVLFSSAVVGAPEEKGDSIRWLLPLSRPHELHRNPTRELLVTNRYNLTILQV
ncbi:hypothetical protein NE237_009271 [Protea cynaroides]|uniref:Uncharacterized protein n=1 Tax=Protea cynaroides TaxID=273540 RepID=A0A9Q0KXH5_9MAGN|nr:hypothetical protein NE237_009271 [Protea cynaroides]